MNVINQFRHNSFELVLWAFAYANALWDRSKRADTVYERLLEVPQSYHELFSHFYGEEAGERFYNYLLSYVVSFRALLEAMYSGDQQLADASLKKMYQSAEERAEFYASINPSWSREQWENLLIQHAQMHYYLAFAIATENYEQSIKVFDRLSYLTVLIGDYFAQGILGNIKPQDGKQCVDNSQGPCHLPCRSLARGNSHLSEDSWPVGCIVDLPGSAAAHQALERRIHLR